MEFHLQRSHNVSESNIEEIDLETEIWREGKTERKKHYYPIDLETSPTKIASHSTTINTSTEQNERDRQTDRKRILISPEEPSTMIQDRQTDRTTDRKRKSFLNEEETSENQSFLTEEEEDDESSDSLWEDDKVRLS